MQCNMIGRLLMPLATAVIMAVPATTLAQSPSGASSPSGGRKVESVVNGRRHVVLYDAAGKVIEVADEVQEKELPKPVADAMHSHRRASVGLGDQTGLRARGKRDHVIGSAGRHRKTRVASLHEEGQHLLPHR